MDRTFGRFFAVRPATFLLIFLVLAIWSLIWKGMALWKAARLGEQGWFIALLVINTLGILEILYLYVFSRKYPAKDTSAESVDRI